MNKIPFSPPLINEDIENQVLDSLRSGWITSGPKVQRLENDIKKYLNVENCICVNSWTSGAMVVLKWFGIGPGDEVIIPAYTYAATALAAMNLGATVVMVDVDDNCLMDVNKLAAAITPKTKAIMPVDIAGLPVNYQKIKAVVDANSQEFTASSKAQQLFNRPLIIADAAHSFGAKNNGKLGNHDADITIYSFHAVKNLTTAEGGAICFNESLFSEPIDRQIRLHCLNGQTKDAMSKTNSGNWKYDIVLQGLKANMPDICAAIGIEQLKIYNKTLERRKEVFQQYFDFFSKCDWATPPASVVDHLESSYHLYMLRIKNATEEERDAIMTKVIANGVSVNVHFTPLPLLTFFKESGYSIEHYPNAHANFLNEISLPIYPQLTDEDVDQVCATIAAAVKEVLNLD